MFEDLIQPVTEFIRTHHQWAAVIVGLMAFGESIAFVSFFVPATALLVAAGGIAGAGIVSFTELAVAGVVGCILGDLVTWGLGRWFGPRTASVWPFRSNPMLLEQGTEFFRKHGWWGVFVGRFFGPLRAVVPLAAGITGMPLPLFMAVSVASAVVFVPAYLAPGALVVGAAGGDGAGPLMILGLLPVAIAVFVVFKLRHKLGLSVDPNARPTSAKPLSRDPAE